MTTSTIQQEVLFNATLNQVYEALTKSAQFSQVTGGAPTEISTDEGGCFTLFGGMITGRNIELVPGKRIVQAWRAGNWNAGDYSVASFELKEKAGQTLLVFNHKGFPEGQKEHLSTGWQENYWGPLKKYFEEIE